MIACNISFTPYQQLVELQFNFAFMNQSQYNGIYSFMLFAKIIRQGIQSVKLPIVDITNFITKNGNYENDCKKIAEIFRKYGLAVIKDPRINVAQNDIFLDLMERYFPKRSKQFYQGNKTIDISPQTHFQTGLTHEYMQKFQNYIQEKSNLTEYNKAVTPLEAGFGPNWRFSWKVQRTKNVIPADFPQIESTLSDWGLNMKNCCLTVSQMLAIGLDLQFNFFLDIISKGSFILAPTAVDLERVKQGDVLVAFHRDFDMFTIHGKARFPGLFSWLNTGEKFMVQVPQGHFLIQTAKQLQWVTGGYITAGFHEVVYSKEVQEAKQKAKEKGKPLWRISSTMFCDSQSSVLLKPHKKFATQNSNKLYPPIKAGDLLQSQLNYMIELK